MNIAEMIDEKLVSFDFDARTKDDVLKGLGKMMYDAGKVNDLNNPLIAEMADVRMTMKDGKMTAAEEQ